MSSMRTGLPQFFNVRGMVPRPLVIHVEHQDIIRQPQITLFVRGCPAGAHEIDHLAGVLDRQRPRPGVEPIPMTAHRGSGRSRRYETA